MTLPDIAGVLKIQLLWSVDGDPAAQSRFYYEYDGGAPSSADCNAMASAILTGSSDAFQSMCTPDTGVHSVIVTDLSSMSGGVGEASGAWVGTREGGLLAPATCAVVNFQITRRYRGGKPRVYLPVGASTDIASSGLWAADFVTFINGAWSTFEGDVISAGVGITITQHCNISYYSGFTNVAYGSPTKYRRVPTQREDPIIDIINGHSTSQVIGSQRRRNRDA